MHPTGQQMLCEVRRGEHILAHDGTAATAVCMVQTSGFRGDIPLVHLPGGCIITAGHPVRINTIMAGHMACVLPEDGHEHQTDWIKPGKIANHRMTACNNLCTLIIRNSHSYWIQGTECLALGHGQVTGEAYHPFYGTNRVLTNAEESTGFAE
eukprot:5349655-Heterocapsa_arctica.AAC.1